MVDEKEEKDGREDSKRGDDQVTWREAWRRFEERLTGKLEEHRVGRIAGLLALGFGVALMIVGPAPVGLALVFAGVALLLAEYEGNLPHPPYHKKD